MAAYRRKPVRAARAELVWRDGRCIATVPTVGPTPERLAKGDVVGRRALQRNVIEEIGDAGELGEDVAQLAAAAEWFTTQAHLAQVRGRMVYSQLVTELPTSASAEKVRARQLLARACGVLGHDAWSILSDTLVWDSPIRGPERRAMFRMALRALSKALTAT
jgi:hypothetical protein